MPDFEDITTTEVIEERRRTFRKRRIALIAVVAGLLAVFGGLTAFTSGPRDSTTPLAATKTTVGETTARETAARQGVTVASERTETSTEQSGSELGNDPIDVLLLGVDKRPDGGSEGMGVRSDAIIVARIEPSTGETRLLSVPRDLYVEIEPGEKDRINSAYAFGGAEQTRSVVERYTGIGIDRYAVIDFAGFEEGVNALGGVRVDVKEGEYPENWNIEPGVQKLNGKRALMYARYRESAGGDLDRIGHQQQILSAVKSKVLKVGTLTKLPELIQAVDGNVESDVGPGSAIALTRALAATQSAASSETKTFQLKGEGAYLDDGRQVLTPLDEENRQVISEFLG